MFLKRSVPNVLATRWNVDSSASAKLTGLFYSGIRRGESVASSLQAAEEKLRSEPETEHPFYWASFSAFGR
jgi:CHAT domain-containing protein